MAEIADAHNINLSNLRWYAAFHDKDHHPHVHLMVFANDAKQGWITKFNIDKLRSLFGNEIFRGEQYRLFEMQTQYRERVKNRFKEVIDHYEQNGYELPPPVNDLFLKLAEQLKSVKGKKVYGYLPKEVKETVDKIVAELAKDGDIAKLYAEWNKINREKLSLYHEKKTPDIPLEDNKEFRSIKNVIIRSAVEFGQSQAVQNQNTGFVFVGIVKAILRAISASYLARDNKLKGQVDSKLKSKIAQKKQAQGLRPENTGGEYSWEQNM